MAGALSFKDHVEVMDELRAKYQRSDDDKKALAAELLQDDIAKAARAREQEVRDAIRGGAVSHASPLQQDKRTAQWHRLIVLPQA